MSSMTFAKFMEERLYGPGGYYSRGVGQSGRDGDYFTAAETGQAFGRLLSECFVGWQKESGAAPFNLMEVGAGEGKLAKAIGASFRQAHALEANRFRYVAVERSASRREILRQQASAMPFSFEVCDTLPTALNGCLFANELVDAFPVHRVRWQRGQLQEAFVTNGGRTPSMTWQHPSTPELAGYFKRLGLQPADGYETEVNLAMRAWLAEAYGALKAGLVFLIDYGRPAVDYFDPARSQGTLRGFHQHHVVSDVLSAEEAIDITADVDFTSLALDAQEAGFKVLAFMDLAAFLLPAAERLAAEPSPGLRPPSPADRGRGSKGEGADWSPGLRYLLHPEGMGSAFQVLLLAKGEPFSRWTFKYNRLARLGLPKV